MHINWKYFYADSEQNACYYVHEVHVYLSNKCAACIEINFSLFNSGLNLHFNTLIDNIYDTFSYY